MDVDLTLTVDRASQRRAVECHPSQAVPGSVLWRRLELLGPHEHLRWLRRPEAAQDPTDQGAAPVPDPDPDKEEGTPCTL